MGRRPISREIHRKRTKFGALLRQWRLDRDIDLREAARKSKMDHTTLSKIESGERPVALDNLRELAKVYGVPWEALLLAQSGQIPSALIRDYKESQEGTNHRTEFFSVRTTPEEKRELTVFLGYLRFTESAERSKMPFLW